MRNEMNGLAVLAAFVIGNCLWDWRIRRLLWKENDWLKDRLKVTKKLLDAELSASARLVQGYCRAQRESERLRDLYVTSGKPTESAQSPDHVRQPDGARA